MEEIGYKVLRVVLMESLGPEEAQMKKNSVGQIRAGFTEEATMSLGFSV